MYGGTLRLPGQFLSRQSGEERDVSNFVTELRRHFERIQPTEAARHGERRPFVFKELRTAEHVFVRHDGPKIQLQMPYDGPFPVIERGEKTFVVHMHGKNQIISVDRLKPAYIISDASTDRVEPTAETPGVGKESASPERRGEARLAGEGRETRTKSGRRVRFPDRYQA